MVVSVYILTAGLVLVLFVVAGSPVVCEELPQDLCSFAISTASKRCVLESAPRGDGTMEYQCRTSEVVVERMSDWIETDECVRACGVDRNVMGISSDSLLEPRFAAKLCSPACYQNCPNIVDLYFNLAAGEGKRTQEPALPIRRWPNQDTCTDHTVRSHYDGEAVAER